MSDWKGSESISGPTEMPFAEPLEPFHEHGGMSRCPLSISPGVMPSHP